MATTGTRPPQAEDSSPAKQAAAQSQGGTVYEDQERLDNLVWDKNDEESAEAVKRMRLTTTCRNVERLAEQKFGKTATLVPPLIMGGFNILYRIRLEGVSPDVMVRLPAPRLIQFPDEKTAQEAATAKYIAEHTRLPVPPHFFSGQDPKLGPFVILQRVESPRSLSSRLTTPSDDPSKTHVLDPKTPEATLKDLWGKVAACVLQLARLTFPRIGALV